MFKPENPRLEWGEKEESSLVEELYATGAEQEILRRAREKTVRGEPLTPEEKQALNIAQQRLQQRLEEYEKNPEYEKKPEYYKYHENPEEEPEVETELLRRAREKAKRGEPLTPEEKQALDREWRRWQRILKQYEEYKENPFVYKKSPIYQEELNENIPETNKEEKKEGGA